MKYSHKNLGVIFIVFGLILWSMLVIIPTVGLALSTANEKRQGLVEKQQYEPILVTVDEVIPVTNTCLFQIRLVGKENKRFWVNIISRDQYKVGDKAELKRVRHLVGMDGDGKPLQEEVFLLFPLE